MSKGLDTLTVISKLSEFTEPSEFIQKLGPVTCVDVDRCYE